MSLENAVVLITGANRGLGLAFAKQALARGAKKVYAAARDAAAIQLEGVIPVTLDVTKPAEIAALAAQLSDVTVLINNAGIARTGGSVAENAQQLLRDHLETNVFGILNLSQAFAPVLAKNGGGAVLNVLSALSWINTPIFASYGASKSAAWGLTNGLRHELRAQGTRVIGLHAGFIDTDMTRGLEVPKTAPEDVARQGFDAIAGNAEEVFVDDTSRQLHQALSSSIYLKDVIAG
ncbi:NAD(P)-dependent dehydrogenase (short-subunit alcohol dehydrogenase family) [Herbaspirillum sp. Sphag1AN]|uniref:SDR family oxidoreductase n=1 Tax=unclassified Herbaspirillum TaxID=2624150 RepID=UPI0016183E65|nr:MULTISPECIES: SDR family oxidoreductase [unclassified Herbaspirillum]MBB3211820.1 NAD(P)-dependent dehydrogenase (short-subunit alcohol dehydrogenase family) [Herbaspirillum sp. Sphag1AN]MBB3244346.1 NAD(P)-dependent dehydrogenase (short-subunit alcohol dehydrogenase family) [Herbaspirillum sp. Sphag64]